MSHDLTYGPVMVLVMMMNPKSLDNLAYKACKLFHNLMTRVALIIKSLKIGQTMRFSIVENKEIPDIFLSESDFWTFFDEIKSF